jgi:AraC-like DNA-binding protein
VAFNPGADDKIYPVVKVATVLDALAAEGLPTEDIIRRIRLSKEAIRSPATRVSLHQVLECYDHAAAHARDPYFAFQAGKRFHLSAYGMYGFAILSSMNHRQTMRFAERYHELATPLTAIAFKDEGDRGIWRFTPVANPRIDARLYRFIVEMQFGITLSLHRDIMGPTFAGRELRVTYRAPNAATHDGIFGSPFLFEQPHNELVFDASWLERMPTLGNEITHASVVALCDAQLEELKLRLGLAGKVRQILMTNSMRPMSLVRVADAMEMSVRTLRRKLNEENTSFRALIDQLRMTMAIRYLRDTDLTVEEIAASLGFSDAANFRHAFRRWTKAAPGEFRGVPAGSRQSRGSKSEPVGRFSPRD